MGMVGVMYWITRNRASQDTTLLNNADIKNIISDAKEREARRNREEEEKQKQLEQWKKQQEEWNKDHREDLKQIFKELQTLNNTVNVHEFGTRLEMLFLGLIAMVAISTALVNYNFLRTI